MWALAGLALLSTTGVLNTGFWQESLNRPTLITLLYTTQQCTRLTQTAKLWIVDPATFPGIIIYPTTLLMPQYITL